ncbi:MAG: hypothetical protein P1U65_15830 [Minwuia sp.]|nr:hypothetical protein [Minwuia sp.]
MTDNNDTQPKRPRPEDTLDDGNIKAAIWKNKGENGSFYATNIYRVFTDKDGKSRETYSFVGTDLLKAAELARGAYERTNELKRAEFKAQRQGQQRADRSPDKNR